MISMKDISLKCGVSVATVSKALNGQPDVGEETATRVRRIARQMGYLPNAAARTLKTNRTNNLGVLFIDKMQSGLAHEYFSSVLESFKVEAESHGYDITFISNTMGKTPMSYLDHCRYRNCDGVVIACVDFTDPAVVALVQSEIPVVTIDHVFNEKTAILSDNVQGVCDLVNHVYACGHRRIAFIHGEDTSVTQKRIASFYKTCESLKVPVPETYIRAALYHDPVSSARETRELLSLKERPTCILYPDDFSFLGGRNVIEEFGLRIPADISVVGYDGIYLSQALQPKLTTLKQDTEQLGKKAAQKLIEAIEFPKTVIALQEMVQGRLLIGGSVKGC